MSQRTWAEIDLAAIRHNITSIRGLIGLRVELMAVIKANAYGHGLAEVARASVLAGAEWLGVATVEEGVTARSVAPGTPICVFSPFAHDEAEDIVRHRLVPLIGEIESAKAVSRAALAVRGGGHLHLEVDTGMGRTGVLPEQVGRLANQVARLPCVLVTGLAAHFASAEDDAGFTEEQIGRFNRAADDVEATDTRLEHRHCANSAGLLLYPEARMNLVRTGLLVYGILPAVPPDTPAPELHPALALKSRISLVRSLPAGHTISYSRTHTLRRASRIAVVPAGYGDGYPRELSDRGRVLVGGRQAPIVGRVCMDVTMVDVTGIDNAVVGSEVVLIGTQGREEMRAEEIARIIGTTPHDVTTRLTDRVPRVYV